MAYEMLSPGVSVNEIDYSDYVAAAATCIIGMVGGARRGPVVPTLVTSQEEFVKLYGIPSTKEYGAYSALQALTQASQLYYQRAVHMSTAAKAGASGTDKLLFTLKKLGTAYNGYTVKIDYTSDTDFNVTVLRPHIQSDVEGTDPVQLEKFEHCSLTTTDEANFVNNKINSASEYVIVALMDSGTLATKTLTFANATDGAAYGTAGGSDQVFSIKTKYYDSTLNYDIVKFTKPDLAGYFSMILMSEDRNTIVEQIDNLSLDPSDERYVDNIIASTSIKVEVTYNKDHVEDDTDISTVEYVIKGGNDGIAGLTEKDIIGTVSDGLKAFSNPEVIDINLLCAPGWYQAEVASEGISICEGRGDAIYIAETPFGLTAQEANAWANGSDEFAADHKAFDSSYGAMYWPWVQVSDPYTRQNIWLPPTGTICAQYAYSDNVGQPWFAPAGLNRGILQNVLAVEYSATKGERDTIYGGRNVVNPIINYRGQGIVIWGQKTMQRKANSLDRVNVRRLMNYLKKIISASTAYYVFEPNDEYNWNKWIDMVEPKLENIKQLRGVYEYKVEMQPTTSEIENNVMPGTIYVKPTKAAEYIPLNFMIAPYGASFDEELNG